MINTKIKLKNIEKSSNWEVVYLTFDVDNLFNFDEWQFVMLSSDKLIKDNKKIKRAYSIASTNKLLQEKKEIKFFVKKVSENWMSNFLTKKIKKWDILNLEGPAWHFIDDWNINKYLFVSIGSWYAAIRPKYIKLINNDSKLNNSNKIVNIIGERYIGDLIPSIKTEFSKQTDAVKNILFLSREKDIKDSMRIWHVQDGLEEAFAFLWWKDFITFICGKPAMVDSIEEFLIQKGISKEFIKFEKY